jgi:hypothetical protein
MKMTCGIIIYKWEPTATEKKNNTSKSSCIYRIWALLQDGNLESPLNSWLEVMWRDMTTSSSTHRFPFGTSSRQ